MAAKPERTRLDRLLVDRGLAETREKAQALILAGEVWVGGERATRAAQPVPLDAPVEVRGRLPFVSRGGLKLRHALERFGTPVAGRVCLDVGASTGGFTDCLLQTGAARVYAADVGYGQLDWRLRQDPRVVVLDRTNVRHLGALPEPIDLVTIDASFISLGLLLGPVLRLLRPDGEIIALVKPQFEVGRGQVGRGGVVRDPALHREVLLRVVAQAAELGLRLRGVTASPILGPAGNREFLVWLSRLGEPADAEASIDAALAEQGAP